MANPRDEFDQRCGGRSRHNSDHRRVSRLHNGRRRPFPWRRRIVMVDSLDKALALRSLGVGDPCIGERDGIKPPGFDFGNSPAELGRAEVAGKTLIQTTGRPVSTPPAGLIASMRALS